MLYRLSRIFGQPVQTKATYLQSGDCFIEGVDDEGNEYFAFTLKAERTVTEAESDSEVVSF